MSVNYSAIALYGIHFDDKSQLDEWLTDQEVDNRTFISGDRINGEEVTVACLNLHTGDGVIVGFDVEFGESQDVYKSMWKHAFPKSKINPYYEVYVRVR